MKNNLLKEIKNIKKLMGLNEDSSNEECAAQLEDANYTVISPLDKKFSAEACIKKENIKCVVDWLNNEGIPNTYNNSNGLCYVQVVSKKTVKPGVQRVPKWFWLFWENYDVTHINTYDNAKIDGIGNLWGQYHYIGKYECNGNDLKYTEMKYCLVGGLA